MVARRRPGRGEHFAVYTAPVLFPTSGVEDERNGKVIRNLACGDETTAETVVFSIKNVEESWHCVIVEDVNGDRAISNPVWTKMVN